MQIFQSFRDKMPPPVSTRYWLPSLLGQLAAASVVQFSIRIKYYFLRILQGYKKSHQEALWKASAGVGKKFYAGLVHACLHMLGLSTLSYFWGRNIRIYHSFTSYQEHLTVYFSTRCKCTQKYYKRHPVHLPVSEIPKMHFRLIWENYSSQLASLSIFSFLPFPIL